MQISTESLAKRIRIESLQMVAEAKASHIGSALSIADIVAVLYGDILRVNPLDPNWSDRDRFILSKGHACVAIYAALAEKGFFPVEKLGTYGKDFSPLMNHISHKVPGVEFSTGSLGHGLSFGVGKALAAKQSKKDWRTFVLLSDGELGEGSNWEAMMFAAHHHLDNLIAILDFNKLQSLTTIDKTLRIEPLVNKLQAFGWDVQEVDGHNHAELVKALISSAIRINKPCFIVAHTIKGKGVSFMENMIEWHYRSPSADDLMMALKDLNCA